MTLLCFPGPKLCVPINPDDKLLVDVELPTRLQNALGVEGIKTVGEVRDLSDAGLRSFQNVGDEFVRCLRNMFGRRSASL